jgi:dipeptidase E
MSSPKVLPQIVAMGGGGFSMEPQNTRLDDYVLSLTKFKTPRVCFVPTASGDSAGYIERFHAAFKNRAQSSHLPLFNLGKIVPRKLLLNQHVIYVGGGNTANMLAVLRVHGVDKILRVAWKRGVILAGVSAGMICWFEAGVTDSFGPLAPLRDGLGFLRGSACPHFDGEKNRRPSYKKFIASGLPAGIAADDGAAAHFVGRNLYRCVSSRPNAKVYSVRKIGPRAVISSLPTDYLGKAE